MGDQNGGGGEQFLIDESEIEVGDSIERGNYGTVFRGKCKGMEVAIKQMPFPPEDEILHKYIEREMITIMRISHPNIVKTYGCCFGTGCIYIIMELLHKGSLRQQLQYRLLKATPLSWTARIEYALDIARAVRYLHSMGLMHRDVKSSNLLIGDDEQIKLCDFGFTREVPNSGSTIASLSTVGTDLWAAPEVLQEQPYGPSADVFSFAMVLCELVTHTLPPMRSPPFFYFDPVKFEGSMPQDLPFGLWNLLCLCAHNIPSERPTFEQILECLEFLRENSFLQFRAAKKTPRKQLKAIEAALEGEPIPPIKEKGGRKPKKNKKNASKRNSKHAVEASNGRKEKEEAQEDKEGLQSFLLESYATANTSFVKFKERIETKLQENQKEEEEVKRILSESKSEIQRRNNSQVFDGSSVNSSKPGHGKRKSIGDIVSRSTLRNSGESFNTDSAKRKGNSADLPSSTGAKVTFNLEQEDKGNGSKIKDRQIVEKEGEGKASGIVSEGGGKGNSEEEANKGKEKEQNEKEKENEEGEGGEMNREELYMTGGFLVFRNKIEEKLSQSRDMNAVRKFIERTRPVKENIVKQTKDGGEKKESRESHSFLMHDRAVVHMTRTSTYWFKKKTLTIECSWLNRMKYLCGSEIPIKVSVSCTHPLKKNLNGRIYIGTLLEIPKAKLVLSPDDNTPMEIQSPKFDFSFTDVAIQNSATPYRGDIVYTVPPMEDVVGSSSHSRMHMLCFEFHMSTSVGLLKDNLKGSLPIVIRTREDEKKGK